MCIRYHCAIGDQTDKCVRRKQTQANHQRVLQSLQIILVHAGVHDIQEDGRDLSTSCQCVFNGRVLSQQLGWKIGVGDVAVVRRELVAVQTERADPELPARIDLAVRCNGAPFKVGSVSALTRGSYVGQHDWHSPVRVQYGAACMLFAGDRLVVDQGQVFALLERRVQSGNRDDCPGGLQTGCRPSVERETDSVLVFDFLKVHGELAGRERLS
jgi:hypothetical protein